LTLTFISVDRWYAICFPLKFKSTTSRAKKSIALIWVLALAFGEFPIHDALLAAFFTSTAQHLRILLIKDPLRGFCVNWILTAVWMTVRIRTFRCKKSSAEMVLLNRAKWNLR